jgi:hypothetical protein
MKAWPNDKWTKVNDEQRTLRVDLNHLYTRRYSMASRAVLKVLYIPTTDLERNVRISILHLPSQNSTTSPLQVQLCATISFWNTAAKDTILMLYSNPTLCCFVTAPSTRVVVREHC